MRHHNLTTDTIQAVFEESVENHSGQIMETINDGTRLFVRSLLPFVAEARPNDRMQGGVALRATESEIWLHPYLFRQVCRNGAIMAHSIESWHVDYSAFAAEYDVLQSLRNAFVVCSEQEVFASSMTNVRDSVHAEVDLLLTLAPLLKRHQDIASGMLAQIMERFSSDADRSRFSLMNAVTSVARDTRDPEQRWRLEELGGGIGARIVPKHPDEHQGKTYSPRYEVMEV